MKVVVAYASDHGSTKGVAGEIADRLTAAGMLVDLNPIDELDAIEGYDAVVLGSAIHNRAWLPQAAAFVQAHRGELAVRPVWLFSVSSVGDTNSFFGPQVGQLMRRMRKESKEIAGFRTALRARDHRNFTGAVARSHWNLAGHVFLKAWKLRRPPRLERHRLVGRPHRPTATPCREHSYRLGSVLSTDIDQSDRQVAIRSVTI